MLEKVHIYMKKKKNVCIIVKRVREEGERGRWKRRTEASSQEEAAGSARLGDDGASNAMELRDTHKSHTRGTHV